MRVSGRRMRHCAPSSKSNMASCRRRYPRGENSTAMFSSPLSSTVSIYQHSGNIFMLSKVSRQWTRSGIFVFFLKLWSDVTNQPEAIVCFQTLTNLAFWNLRLFEALLLCFSIFSLYYTARRSWKARKVSHTIQCSSLLVASEGTVRRRPFLKTPRNSRYRKADYLYLLWSSCTSQFLGRPSPPPPPPGQPPGIWLGASSAQAGIWLTSLPAPWGIWLCPKLL